MRHLQLEMIPEVPSQVMNPEVPAEELNPEVPEELNPEIPEEMIREILVRVRHQATFVRCGAVCRRWRNLILAESSSIVRDRDLRLKDAVGVTKFAMSKQAGA